MHLLKQQEKRHAYLDKDNNLSCLKVNENIIERLDISCMMREMKMNIALTDTKLLLK